MWKLQLFNLNYDEKEKNAVREVLDAGWLTMSKRNIEFEERFGRYHKSIFCLTVNSCTTALHLALIVAGGTDK